MRPLRILLHAISAAFLFCLAWPAGAMTFEPAGAGEVIRAAGPIEAGDAGRLKKLLDEDHRYRYGMQAAGLTLHLHSPGGNVVAGIELANTVRDRGLMTHVDANSGCFSACTFVFMGGVKRTILGKYGIHAMSKGAGKDQITIYSDRDLEAVQLLTSTLINLAQQLIGDSRVITAMLTVPSATIRVVPDNLLADWRIITVASRPTQRMKASFDCGAETLNEMQKLVCDDLVLAEADRRIAAAYEWLANKKVVDSLSEDQERWAKYRDSCRHVLGPSPDFGRWSCVREAYDIRVKQLEGLMSYHAASESSPAAANWNEHTPSPDIMTIRRQQ